MTELRIRQTEVADRVGDILDILADDTASSEDRAAAWAIGHVLQMKIRLAMGMGKRVGPSVQDELIAYMEANRVKELGPLTIRSTAVDPAYPCNARDNWDDADVQDTLEELAQDPNTRAYVRTIPAHREIAVDVLAQDVQLGVQAAQLLYRELNRKGWRTEQARRLSLAVREPKGTA